MCELLALSSALPTSAGQALFELARHGGDTGPHRDGWGIAYMHDGDAFVVREPDAAHDSACLGFLRARDRATTQLIAHIRRATHGARLLRNTQPFQRELGGHVHLFAHNGMLAGAERLRARWNVPIGDTDSERAFCALLDRVRPLWDRGIPELDERLDEIEAIAAELRMMGPANFLYSDGDALFVHAHRRRTDGGTIEPPGLHLLQRSASEVLVASVPLTAEAWMPLVEGELVAIRDGRVLARRGAR